MPRSPENHLPRIPLAILAVCWLLMFGSFLVPEIPLNGQLANGAVYVAKSAGLWGVPAIVGLLTLLLISRSGMPWKNRVLELVVLPAVISIVLLGGNWLSEHLLKPTLGVHRPNVAGMDDERSLSMSLEAFYGMDSNQERSDWLRQILENKYFKGIKLSELVRQYWISEGGSSLPAGHVIGAFMILTVALLSTWVLTPSWRFALACLLIPWTLAVCYAEILLRMHWPNDLIVSAMAGILLGIGVFKFFQWSLWKRIAPGSSLPSEDRTEIAAQVS